MINVSLWHLLGLVACTYLLAALVTLGAVALGGFLVFRTKRESHDTMFQFRPPKGDAWNMPDEFGRDVGQEDEQEPPDEGAKLVKSQAERFMKSFETEHGARNHDREQTSE